MIYNDFDRHACAWLRELIKAGHLPEGTVDERSIKDVRGDDIRDARQWHTFAGIGGWPYALRLAGWPESIRTWTGSCPCQPYSSAGKGKGDADERNLWPDFYRLIRECRPDVVFGEQVENAVGHGWLDGVFADLEGEGYACGAAVLGAHGVGAPHMRQRLYWVAHAIGATSERNARAISGTETRVSGEGAFDGNRPVGFEHGGATGGMANAHGGHASEREEQRGGEQRQQPENGGAASGMADARPSPSRNVGGPVGESATEWKQEAAEFARRGAIGDVGNTEFPRLERLGGDGDNWRQPGRIDTGAVGSTAQASTVGAWDRFDLLPCRDGKARRVEPGTFPLVAGVSRSVVRGGDHSFPINAKASSESRVNRLRGYGNAIVPQVAAAFITAFMQSVGIQRDGAGNV